MRCRTYKLTVTSPDAADVDKDRMRWVHNLLLPIFRSQLDDVGREWIGSIYYHGNEGNKPYKQRDELLHGGDGDLTMWHKKSSSQGLLFCCFAHPPARAKIMVVGYDKMNTLFLSVLRRCTLIPSLYYCTLERESSSIILNKQSATKDCRETFRHSS